MKKIFMTSFDISINLSEAFHILIKSDIIYKIQTL